MTAWEKDLDRWLTTPPDEPESNFFCENCGEPFYPDDLVFDCDGYKYCKECAGEWLEEHATKVTEEECYGKE